MTTYDINGIEVTKEQLMKLADYVTRRTGNYCGISLVSLPDDEDIAGYLKKNGVPVEDGMYYVDRGEAGDFPSAKDADTRTPCSLHWLAKSKPLFRAAKRRPKP